MFRYINILKNKRKKEHFLGCLHIADIGDGWCSDEANTEQCNFDGGDCCGDFPKNDFCSACWCHTDRKYFVRFFKH